MEIKEVGDAPDINPILWDEEFKRNKVYKSSWSSPEAFSRYLRGLSQKDAWYRDADAWNDGGESFNGTKTWKEALDLAAYGWKEGGEIIERVRNSILALNATQQKPVSYGIAGSVPNVPRAIAGNIFNMKKLDTSKASKRPVITLVYNMCENGGVDKTRITNKAATVAALIDQIEAKGFACEVIATAVTSPSGITAMTSVVVKNSNQGADLNRLAFGLGHASMFRRLIFADWEYDNFCSELGWGLGCAKSTKPSAELAHKNVYVIKSNLGMKMKKFDSVESSAKEGLKYLVEELRRQGCPAFATKKVYEDETDPKDPPEEDTEDFYDDFD